MVDKNEARERLLAYQVALSGKGHTQAHEPNYEVLSDSLIWADEYATAMRDVRPLFRYRTTVILGRPDVRFEWWWTLAKEVIPTWVGFRVVRCQPNPDYVKFYRDSATRALKAFEDGAC